MKTLSVFYYQEEKWVILTKSNSLRWPLGLVADENSVNMLTLGALRCILRVTMTQVMCQEKKENSDVTVCL